MAIVRFIILAPFVLPLLYGLATGWFAESQGVKHSWGHAILCAVLFATGLALVRSAVSQ